MIAGRQADGRPQIPIPISQPDDSAVYYFVCPISNNLDFKIERKSDDFFCEQLIHVSNCIDLSVPCRFRKGNSAKFYEKMRRLLLGKAGSALQDEDCNTFFLTPSNFKNGLYKVPTLEVFFG